MEVKQLIGEYIEPHTMSTKISVCLSMIEIKGVPVQAIQSVHHIMSSTKSVDFYFQVPNHKI